MGFLVFLVFVFIVISVMRDAAKKQTKVVLPPDFFGTHTLPPEHVRHVGGGPGMVSAPAMVPAGAREESSSEAIGDETAYDHDLNLGAAEVVSLEQGVRSVAPRLQPDRSATMETEVDWNAEHDRFHKRYVDVRPDDRPAAHGLMDELRNPAGARRAILLAEILGPPVSMRR